ncbi:MAG: ABC transporter permease [Ardenticatenaceae bacterium]|nr:ABC transporter permease [Ardenticatenaceae bacterium]MCB9444088.1 ABC transporter permease [Ardenticatenaceae bacterium]
MEKRSRLALLIGPPGLYLLILFLLPLGIMAVFSFRAGTIGDAQYVFTLENYQEFLAKESFHRLLWISARLAFVISLISVILAYPLAYYLTFRAGPRRILLLTLLIVPTWTSYLLRIFAWRLILGSSGLLNTFLLWLGIIDKANPILLYSRNAVVITLIYVWVPFVALPIFAALERIDPSLLEAAADLGCRPWEAFLRVTLPLSLPGVTAGFFFALIPTLGEYVTPLLVGGGQGAMYGNLIQDQFVRALNWPMGSVMSLAMLVLVIPLLFLFTRVGASDLMEF